MFNNVFQRKNPTTSNEMEWNQKRERNLERNQNYKHAPGVAKQSRSNVSSRNQHLEQLVGFSKCVNAVGASD
jgi:hypothetical protein